MAYLEKCCHKLTAGYDVLVGCISSDLHGCWREINRRAQPADSGSGQSGHDKLVTKGAVIIASR
jgi:hypothetical protein